MADFHQSSVISTLHRLGATNVERLETELEAYSKSFPVALVLPCLYSELERTALPGIVEQLRTATYLNEVVVSLGQASKDEFLHAQKFFSVLPQKVKLVWIEGPRIQELLKLLAKNDIEVGQPGKGQACWLAYGYILAKGECEVIAQHDCDIVNYTREMLVRLCYPCIAPTLRYEYCKGYYARVSDRLHGRVTRLFITPLIRSVQKLTGLHPFLTFLDNFRYPLAGEFAMVTDLARINRIPGDWGLEIGTLAETYRNCALRRICQSELSDSYDHKHQELSLDNPEKGLMKMSIDIAKSLFRNLAIEGVALNEGDFKALGAAYQRMAQDTITKYEDDATINSLYFDHHEERGAVEAFTKAIEAASEQYLVKPVGIPLISNWIRPLAAIPNFFGMLLDAVEEDNR